MASQKPVSPAFDPLNRSFPPFVYGGIFHWDSRWGSRCGAVPGGAQIAGDGLSYTFGGASLYCVYDHGRGQYIEYDPALVDPDPIPTDGQFPADRSTYFNASRPAASAGRGPFTAQLGLTLSDVGTPDHHILAPAAGTPATVPRAQNTSGATKRMYRLESTSGAFKRCWSILLKRTDEGKIDGTVATLGTANAADPLGANLAGATVYQKIRSDGWYRLYCMHPIDGANVYYFVSFENGADVFFECPQTESVGTSIEEPTPPVLTNAADAPNRPVFQLGFFDSLGLDLPQAGWIACAFTPRKDAIALPTKVYPSSVLLRLAQIADPANYYHQIYISSTYQVFAYQCYAGGTTSQAFLQGTTADIKQGRPVGFVGTWGYRAGTVQFVAAQNGSITEVDTTGVLPTGPCTLEIGSQAGGASPANVNVWSCAVGNRMLNRAELGGLSRWFYKIASQRTYMGLTGE